jgi:type II secretion system protein C
MRNPVWILTISLTLLFIVVVGVLTLTQKQVPGRASLAPTTITQESKKAISPIDIRKIYERDLFKTYKPITESPISPVRELRIPQPPAPLPLITPPAPQVSFIDPLQISIKGIIRTGDDYNNRAIIVDEKTKTEEIYSIGDIIEDAEILSIERNKVIFIRSNGQQETVFLNTEEAQTDPVFSAQDSWETVVQKTGPASYSINTEKLTQRITSLAQFIEMLDITTALQNGISVGCRIGRMDPDSIGYALGFQYNDLITAINDMPVRSTKERIHVYHTLKILPPNAHITCIRG